MDEKRSKQTPMDEPEETADDAVESDFPETLTIEEAAGYLRLGLRTVYNLANSGEIPAARIGGTWRFSKYTLARWLGQKTMENLVRPIKQRAVEPTYSGVGRADKPQEEQGLSDASEDESLINFTWGRYGVQGLGVKSVKTAVDLRGGFNIDDEEGLFRFFYTSSGGANWVQRALEVQSDGVSVGADLAAKVAAAVLNRIPEPRQCPQVGYVNKIVQRIKKERAEGSEPGPRAAIDQPYNEPKQLKDSIRLEGTFQLDGIPGEFTAHFKQADGPFWATKVIEPEVSGFISDSAVRGLEVTLMVLEAIYRDVPPIRVA
jgi:excisionase family DNA binding protein